MTALKSLTRVLLGTSVLLSSAALLSGCNNAQSGSPATSAASNALDAASTAVKVTEDRQRISKDWHYLENPILDAAKANDMADWQSVDLPHTWNALDTTDVITGYRRDGSWYRKVLDMTPDAEQRYFLHFEAAQMKASIYVNGKKAGDHVGGYTGFDIEITDQVKAGLNEVLVRVDNGVDFDLVPSQKADFFQYGGLTRDVFVVTRPEVFVEQVRINTDVNADRAILTLNPIIDGGEASSYASTIIDPNGYVVDEGEGLEFTVENPLLWHPDTPNLYKLETQALDADGNVIDTREETFGLRWFEFKENGPFFFNGERLLLRGTHLHEGFAGVGSAMSDEQRIADMEAIKELGANFLRLGHYSHDPVVYDAADRLGIILYDEVPWNRGGIGGEQWRKNTQEMTRSMITQNYNRASVILWSLGNEMYWLPDQEGGGDKARVAEELQLLHNIAKEMDPDRKSVV